MAHSYYSFNERQAGSVPIDTIDYPPITVTEERFDSVEALKARVAELLAEGA